ncbi:pyruvate formate-lyase activating enzyme [Candidatus Methylomirabilis lanthanidiphila]|uniref:Pyruvate formate-lyase activating enzyme n=1 Tax=Candidatus Methylomirabilis lanthanidiphila TaxID=2211376 RepID=A0A564ZLG5_9BACT|nr:AmmeMemoRadiSam system radical SAM enzyme [Candidatus Methylomirabilis lanthanidiphila]VUZ85492.1 pyruvate formate-lyase activating enzyme [Candidatus Methylomirabilis lanthanidiphila]
MSATTTLAEVLTQLTKEGELYEKLPNRRVRCYACGHRCLIPEGRQGVCRVRYNKGGALQVPTGYVGALQVDPVEKKPFFHALPGSLALSFGMLGCDFHCGYCLNWITSQALRDPAAVSPPELVTADELVNMAKRHGAPMVASTYNEPLITSEWAVEIFRVAKARGLKTAYISNGNGTPEVLDYLKPWVDLYKVDLKGFNDANYRKLGGVLGNVLDTIRLLVEKRFWVEIVTLVVPGFNDSDKELAQIAEFLASVSVDLPWHVTAFHQDYKMLDHANTAAATLFRAAEIGRRAGLHYVYVGNLPGRVGHHENTYCPACRTLLIERHGYTILKNAIQEGACPTCQTSIPGVWN